MSLTTKITPEMVKELRERTGVGMAKCKEALDQCQGDMERAIDFLRKAGMASAVKKEGRETKEGVIAAAEAAKTIALIEVNSETDFVAQNEKFKQFVQDVAHEAAETHPASVEAFVQQKYRKDPSITIDQYRSLVIQSLGENIQIKRLHLFAKGHNSSFGLYSHMGGKIVTFVEIEGALGLEALAKDIAMHIAAESPDYLRPEDVPADVKAREEEVARGQVAGKPANIVDNIVKGKIKAFYDQVCLLNQKYVKDNSITITELVAKEAARLGKPLTLVRFVRWRVGE